MWSRGKYLLLILPLVACFLATPVHAESPKNYDPSVCAADNTGKPLSQACQEMIKAFPKPAFEQIDLDKKTLSAYSFWRVGPAETNLYDQPGGSVIEQMPKGFNFVRAINLSVEGWIQIQGGKWVSKNDAKESSASYFAGVAMPDGLEYPFAWVLDKSNIYVSETPGGPASSKTGRFLKRYELVNLFSVAKGSDGKDWYMIGPNQWVKQTFLAKVDKIAKPKDVSGYWVAIDLYEQVMVAYEDDKPVYATLVATGLPNHDTPEGTFKVWAQLDHDSMSGSTGAPSAYALQFVPWVLYFDKDGRSLHGTYWHDLFGYRQSHGCVNLTISDAHYIYNWMLKAPIDKETNQPLLYVYIFSSGQYGQGVIRQ
jgi:hypothetical protein